MSKMNNIKYKDSYNQAIQDCIGIIDDWREAHLNNKEQNPVNYGLILDFKRQMAKLKESEETK